MQYVPFDQSTNTKEYRSHSQKHASCILASCNNLLQQADTYVKISQLVASLQTSRQKVVFARLEQAVNN